MNAENVKEFYRGMGCATPQCCAAALDISVDSALGKIRHLAKKGWLEKVDGLPDFFRFVEARNEEGPAAETQEKLWRAARIAKSFTAWDLAMYAGVSLDYARGYASWLVSKRLLERAGTAKAGQRQVFRCIENPPRETPRWRVKATEKDAGWMEALDGAWALARAIIAMDIESVRGAYVKVGEKLENLQKGPGTRV